MADGILIQSANEACRLAHRFMRATIIYRINAARDTITKYSYVPVEDKEYFIEVTPYHSFNEI